MRDYRVQAEGRLRARVAALEAELAAERALADRLADAVQAVFNKNTPDHPPWKLYAAVDAMRPALAAHRAARTPQEKP